MAQGLVHGIIDPVVGFTGPEREPVRISSDDLDSPVGGSAVDDDVFDVRIPLIENAPDRLLDDVPAIPNDGNDADKRSMVDVIIHAGSFAGQPATA